MDVTEIDLKSWLAADESANLDLVKAQWDSIPLLNAINCNELQDSKLVRFRGMVQDMFNPEFYYEKYEVINRQTKVSRILNGKYQDSATCNSNHYINVDGQNITNERQTIVVISPPGLNDWALKLEKQLYSISPSNSSLSSCKRSFDLEHSVEVTMNSIPINTVQIEHPYHKKLCTSERSGSSLSSSVFSFDCVSNFPLPGRAGAACHVRIYDKVESLKLHELVDCVGFLSQDTPSDSSESQDEDTDDTDLETRERRSPSSLIPKIHCVTFKKILDSSPLWDLPQSVQQNEIITIKTKLEEMFTTLLLGDVTAAQYLIYHLISKIYSRQDSLVLGKFSLNISNIPAERIPNFGQLFYQVLEMLLPKSHYISMSLENMNSVTFIPKKDYETNRITTGILQLSNNTHLVMDECKLTPGQMNSEGIRVVNALANLIKNQQIEYDFTYYQMHYDCDIPILILSEGKSLLPSDFRIHLRPASAEALGMFEQSASNIITELIPNELLTKMREYLMTRRHSDYDISHNMNGLVQREFVEMRSREKATADDLHNLLVLARLVCLTEGKTHLDESSWRHACLLEKDRKSRDS